MRTRVSSAVAAVVVLAASFGAAASASPAHKRAVALPRIYVAHLRLAVTSTSDWTTVKFSPGTAVYSRLSGQHGNGQWTAHTDGVSLSNGRPGRHKTIIDNLVYLNLTSQSSVRITVQKGDDGKSTVKLSHVVGAVSTPVRTITDDRTEHDTNQRVVRLTRQDLMGNEQPPMERVDPRKLVLAFYYPWYVGYHSPVLSDHPVDPRPTDTRRGVSRMTAQARHNGVDGFISSWAGEKSNGRQFRLALHAAQRQHQLISGYLESVIARNNLLNSENDELEWLLQLLHYGKQPGFLRSHGVPVVFVYQMHEFSPRQWHWILDQVHSRGYRVHLVGDDYSPGYLPYEWGLHNYGVFGSVSSLTDYSINSTLTAKGRTAVGHASRGRLFAATVSPGFNNRKSRGPGMPIIKRRGGRRYTGTWRAALAGQPDWVLVTSWNEWYEDTAIEPGKQTGHSALRLTRIESERWKRN
jgi:hypothetical protein